MIEGHYTQKLTNGECPYELVYFEVDLLRNIICSGVWTKYQMRVQERSK